MYFSHKSWTCLVDAGTIAHLRVTRPKGSGGLLPQALWRQIELVAKAAGLELRLMNVDEEAARGGYWSCGYSCVNHKFTWDDLNDREFIAGLFQHEQVGVMRAGQAVLDHVREHLVPLRAAMVL
ncbi:hypothetical protein D3C71_20790 [compost metagenome]